MAPKAKISAAQKAANKAAGIEKRKLTMAAKAAEKRLNDPVFQARLARANAEFGDDEQQVRGGPASNTQQTGGESEQEHQPEQEHELVTPATSKKAGKRPAPDGESSAAGSRKRPRTVADTGSPAALSAAEQDSPKGNDDGYIPSDPGEGEDAETPVTGKSGKGKGKGKAGTGNTTSKAAERLRSTALAGPLRVPAASKSAAAHSEFERIQERSFDVHLDDPLVINNTRLIWNVCERCASHLGKGHTCTDGSDDPSHPRRCTRCVKGNGKCIWLRPATHSGLYAGMNDTIRAWLAWEQSARDMDEEDMLREHAAFSQLNIRFVSHLRSFQQSRNQRIGAQATPHKRSRAAAHTSGDLDGVVDQMQRLVAVGESLVDYASLVAKMVLDGAIEQNKGDSPIATAISSTIERVIQRHSAWGQITEPMFQPAPPHRGGASAPPAPRVDRASVPPAPRADRATPLPLSSEDGSNESDADEEEGGEEEGQEEVVE